MPSAMRTSGPSTCTCGRPMDKVQVRRTELVGPTIGKELVGQSMIALPLLALGYWLM